MDPGAELERVAAWLPRLAQLTLPGEWAVGWGAAGPPTAAVGRRPGRRPRPGPGPAAPDPSAAPLARLLLACRGRDCAPAVRVALPSSVPGAEERIRSICAAAALAAAGRAEGAGEGAGRPEGARLPSVECVASNRDGLSWPGWL